NWTRFLYGVDWENPALYDAVVNLGTMNVAEACEMAATGARQKCFEFAADGRAQLEDFAIACRVRAALAKHPATSHLEFEASSREGRVSVLGRVSTVEEFEEMKRVAQGVVGVVALDVSEVWLPAHA
ncbi:MAG TPA: BON domain-containing protein, partial [Terriglobia bacterium]|nr:BON domain-containing protein [Terriglobia bacterium]